VELPCNEPHAEQLQAAIEACLRGLKKAGQVATTAHHGDEAYLDLLLRQSRLSETDKRVVMVAARWRIHGLRAARQGAYGRARVFFGRARRVVADGRTASGECVVLCESFQLASEAYLDYRLKTFGRARDRLRQALEMDAYLECGEGYALLHLHRVQLLHNIVRIAAKQGRKQEALHLAFQLLGYLEGRHQVLPGAGSWDARAISNFPTDLLRTLFDQIVAEIALVVAATPDIQVMFASAAADHLDCREGSGCFLYPVAHAWFDLTHLFIEDRGLFLTGCRNFLENSYPKTPLLWSAVVVDLVTVCKHLDFVKAHWLVLDLGLQRIPRVLENALQELMAT
jgi:hypothetical protein